MKHAALARHLMSTLLALGAAAAWAGDESARLASELSTEGQSAAAAVEYRRLALQAPDAAPRAAYYWMAAREYVRAGESGVADKMLDRAEDADPAVGVPARLLRGENALGRRSWDEGSFYFESVLAGSPSDDARRFAARRLAGVGLRGKNFGAARSALAKSPVEEARAQAAVEAYARGSDKSPRIGGLLGMVPGLGYLYAGEYANGLRSIILNGLFIYGMVDTANDEEWGAFAAISFFELTWYSGSIYGGVDASHRYNRRRLDAAIGEVHGRASFEPEAASLPLLALRFTF